MLIITAILLAGMPDELKPPPGHENVKLAEKRVVFETEAGLIVFALYPEVAPKHVEHIMQLVEVGGYTSSYFSRSEYWVLQLQEVIYREKRLEGTLLSSQDFEKLAKMKLLAEFSQLPHKRGVLSMSHDDGDINSGRTAFSVILQDAPHLDPDKENPKGKYTVFGRVEYGMDVLDELSKVPVVPGTKNPIRTLKIRSAALVDGTDIKQLPPPPAKPIVLDSKDMAKLIDGGGTVADKDQARRERDYFLVGLLLAMIGFSLIPVFKKDMKPERVKTIVLVSVLIAGIALFTLLFPVGIQTLMISNNSDLRKLIPIVVFFGIIALFRLMGRFENPT